MRKTLAILALGLLAAGLAGCGLQSDDSYGAYADGDFYFVVDHANNRINFTTEGHPAPETLLKEAAEGKGIGFKTWRNKVSCGLTDDKGNSFIVPRESASLAVGKTIYELTAPPAAFQSAGGAPHSVLVTVKTKAGIPYRYLYDDTIGIRYIDRNNQDGSFDRRIYLEQGVGLLGHCRGFSFDDYQKPA